MQCYHLWIFILQFSQSFYLSIPRNPFCTTALSKTKCWIVNRALIITMAMLTFKYITDWVSTSTFDHRFPWKWDFSWVRQNRNCDKFEYWSSPEKVDDGDFWIDHRRSPAIFWGGGPNYFCFLLEIIVVNTICGGVSTPPTSKHPKSLWKNQKCFLLFI